MTDAEAVERAVEITGVERYRYLCLGHPDAATRSGYLALCRRVAEDGALPPAPPPRPAAREAVALLARARACPYRSAPSCGCASARCALKGGAAVAHGDCFDCLNRFPA